jgi:CBS domain-containing protein
LENKRSPERFRSDARKPAHNAPAGRDWRTAMKAADVMTRQVITIDREAPVGRAIRLLLQHRISGLPVVDTSGNLEGIVTEGDFLRRVETGTTRRRPRWVEFLLGPGKLAQEYVQTHGRFVGDVMTTKVRTVCEDTPLEDVVRMMEKHRVKRFPVVKGDRVVGIISRANLLRALATVATELPAGSADDTKIREGFFAELKGQRWAPRTSVNAVVRNGVVELWGNIFDEREREALRVMAQNLPGVKAVHDHLVWVDPASGFVGLSTEDASDKKVAS